MSIVYSTLYLATKQLSLQKSVITPIGCLIHSQLKAMAQGPQHSNISVEDLTVKHNEATGNFVDSPKINLSQTENTNYRCNYGKWSLLILSFVIFSFLNTIFPKSLIVIFFGFILKATIIYTPKSITHKIENLIQKLHLQVYLQTLNSKAIELYLDICEKINFFIIFYSNKERSEQLIILNRIKDSVSRIQLELQENQQIKNRSFIVAVKIMQSMPNNIKSYENIGVNCEIIKPTSDVGKQLLKLLQEKTFTKQRSQHNGNLSKIQEPTKDNFALQTKTQKSAIYPGRSQSLQQKVERMKSSMNVPTSEKKRINQVKIKDTPFMIKRSQTDIGEQFQSQQESPKRTRQNHHIAWSNTRAERLITRPQNNMSNFSPQLSNEVINQENSSSVITNVQNVAVLDIGPSENSYSRTNPAQRDFVSLGRILEADEGTRDNEMYMNSVVMTEEPTSPKVIPPGLNISSIDHPNIHPFKLNLSSLTNPLVLSNTISNTKILPNSVVTSTQHQIISQVHKQPSFSSISQHPPLKTHISNVSHVSTVNVGEHFSQESSIPNKLEVSINESDYSDMFDSEGEQEPKLEIKVEVIIENPRDNGLKPRMEICYIELYSNDELRFMSMHDKLLSTGKLLKMHKNPDNYYELVILQPDTKKQGQTQESDPKKCKQVPKRIKFRGQARPFMKYLQKV